MRENPRYTFWFGIVVGALGGALITFTLPMVDRPGRRVGYRPARAAAPPLAR
ncbi:MAG: hypothetical protein KIS91_02810 [Anaerolineae bacterium]|nr:hypothetical protein [Anaerolineae bacterium]